MEQKNLQIKYTNEDIDRIFKKTSYNLLATGGGKSRRDLRMDF